jgi:NAD(P)H-hydrate epimerase
LHAARWSGSVEAVTPAAIDGAALVVDALFGSGLSRALDGEALATLGAVAQRALPMVAVDVPSGVMGDTGESLGAAPAACTITFARKKRGHALLPGRELCGDIVVADIGIPAAALESLSIDCWENHPALWREQLPRAQLSSNKYTRGHALLYGGYPMTGAARMAARAAARVGAGLTTVAVPEAAVSLYASTLTSIMVQPLATGGLARLLSDTRFTAFLIGPGAGVNDATRDNALALLRTARPVLLDADAITVFASRTAELTQAIRGPCVMTPHDGEFARLFDPRGDKLTRARAAARQSGAVIVLKGADSVIAAADGRAIINTNAPASLATAGAGDVLGGMILGLLAQGMDAFLAAAAGVWMHGAAAAAFGPGLLAEDLPDLLPAVLRALAHE